MTHAECKKKPFFSIVIPTKNRSFLVKYAVKSILQQTFGNFELIIVDNDDTNLTKKIINTFNDNRIRYYRTGNLSMPDNWEYGCRKMMGEYLIIIEDKMVLKPNSLLKISKIIYEKRPEVIKWQHDFFNEETFTGGKSHPQKFKAQFVNSNLIIKNFLDFNFSFFNLNAPIGYDSCINEEVVKKIQKGPLKRLCVPVSVDYTMALQILNTVNKIFVMPNNLATMGGIKYSNGLAYYKNNIQKKRFLSELKIKEESLYKNLPINTPTIHNALLNDYINLSKIIGGKLTKFKLNKFNYFISIYNELHIPNENINIKNELKVWKKSLLKQDKIFIAKVQKEIYSIKNKKLKNNRPIKLIIRTLGWISRKIKKPLPTEKIIKYPSILDYIKQEY